MVTLLHVHPSRDKDLIEPTRCTSSPGRRDRVHRRFGNRCTASSPRRPLRLHNSTLIRDPDPDQQYLRPRVPVGEVPTEFLCYLLSSRYCEVDRFSNIAYELFGHITPGWSRVQAICDWVHGKVTFSYPHARPTKSALDVYTERIGVCRDFQHLAITFCRAMNIPARYATGYLGDIAWPVSGPMDFSAWFEVYLENRWWTFDARHAVPRIGRVLMAVGRDASDVAITTSFGQADLRHFTVVTGSKADRGERSDAPSLDAPGSSESAAN